MATLGDAATVPICRPATKASMARPRPLPKRYAQWPRMKPLPPLDVATGQKVQWPTGFLRTAVASAPGSPPRWKGGRTADRVVTYLNHGEFRNEHRPLP